MAVRARCHFPQTSQMFCFVGLLYLFIFKVVTTERRKQRKKKKNKQIQHLHGRALEERGLANAGEEGWRCGDPAPARTRWGVLPALPSGVLARCPFSPDPCNLSGKEATGFSSHSDSDAPGLSSPSREQPRGFFQEVLGEPPPPTETRHPKPGPGGKHGWPGGTRRA